MTDINERNIYGCTALLRAIQSNKLDLAKSLIELGADVTIADDIGRTPLMMATKLRHFDVVSLIEDKLK